MPEEGVMSRRRNELARLEAAGWTVIVDSPWRRGAQRVRAAVGAALAMLASSGRPA
jgi:hypothetical protein